MKRILFINGSQFGYLTDLYNYCLYLKDDYDIQYICFDKHLPKIALENVRITYIPYKGPKLFRGLLYLIACIYKCIIFKGFIFVIYFPKSYLLQKIVFWKKMHLDIRSLSVSANSNTRESGDKDIQKAVNQYESCSFISQGIKNKMICSPTQKTYILPLGADIISQTPKTYDDIQLLYIGTLTNRNIIDTVKGVKSFLIKHPDINLIYDIVGDGEEYKNINLFIKDNKLENYIHLHGMIPHTELKPFLDTHNIGISYVPITEYFEYQPPTKTYEYILSGLFCIATRTFSNKEIINDQNGLLISDNANEFSSALEKFLSIKIRLNDEHIRSTLLSHTWKNIIDKKLRPIIEKQTSL